MYASSVTTIGRPHGQVGTLHFAEKRTLCFGVDNGVLLEDTVTGHQRHIWVSKQQGAEVSVGPPLIAVDPSHGQIALHQPGSSHLAILSLNSHGVIDHLPARSPELPVANTALIWLHLSFSNDGLKLAAVAETQCAVLCVFKRQDPQDPFEFLCSAELPSKGNPSKPNFFPGNSNYISFADDSCVCIVHTEEFSGQIDLKQRWVDLGALDASNAITTHSWTSSGDLVIGSAHGLLFLVEKAAVVSESQQYPGFQLQSLQAVPLLLSELSKWNAGAVVAIHVSMNQLTLVMECPDGKGGLVLSFATSTEKLANTQHGAMRHVEIPTSRVVTATVSPNGEHLAILDSYTRVVLVPVALPESHSTARVVSFGLSGLGPVLSVAEFRGVATCEGALLIALQDSGALHLYSVEDAAPTPDGSVAPGVTLLRSASLGQPGACLDTHPSVPVVAVATTGGVVQLIHADALKSGSAPDSQTGTTSSVVSFSAYCLPAGIDKVLKWSPNGAFLVSLDMVSGTVSFLQRRSQQHSTEPCTVSLLGHFSIPNANLLSWHQSEDSPPLLLVHQSNGHLLVIDVPQNVSSANDKFFTPGSLQRSKLRLSAPLVDMHVWQQRSSATHMSVLGVTWDRSIRRFRVSTEQFRTASAKKTSSTIASAAPVDAEVVQGLPALPAQMELSGDGDSFFVATRSGAVLKVKLPSLEVLPTSLPICGAAQNCCSALVHFQGVPGLLVMADRAGSMHAVRMDAVGSSDKTTAISKKLTGTADGLLRLSVTCAKENFCLRLGAESSPSLEEAERTILEKSKASDLVVWKDEVDKKMKSIATALRRVKDRNAALTSLEQLPVKEFTVCDVLAAKMRSDGKKANQELRRVLRNEVLTEGCKAKRVMADTWHANKEQAKVLLPLQQYALISPAESSQDSGSNLAMLPVERMAEPRANKHEVELRQYIIFLRKVEQEEFDGRPVAEQGLCATFEMDTSNVAEDAAEADTRTPKHSTSFSRTISFYNRTELAFSDVRNGSSEHLYSPLQQHLIRRKLAQIRLLTAEVLELRRSYNRKFDEARASKEAAVAKIEGNLERVTAIQAELGLKTIPHWSSFSAAEDETQCIRVDPHELSTTAWISPAERARIEQEKAEKEAQRRAAEADTSRARALQSMMNSTPAIRKPDAFQHLVREPWMEMPLKAMTKAQREALREFDKKVQEVEESVKKAERILEGERKTLEDEVAAVIRRFNEQLTELYHEYIMHTMSIASAERTQLALIASVTEVEDTQTRHEEAAAMVVTQSARMSTVRRLLDLLNSTFSLQQAEHMNLQRTSKLLDRSLTKAFQHLDAQMHVVEATYRDTMHCATYKKYGTDVGDGVKPDPADLIENAPAHSTRGQRNTGATGDNRDDNTGVRSWRPGNNPPQAATWKHAPPFADDDRPEGIEMNDWLQLMLFRDCKLGILEQIEECWKVSSSTAALLDDYKAELDHNSKMIRASLEHQRQTDPRIASFCMDVPAVLTCKGGQVEVTEQTLIPDLEDAVMLATSSVNVLNTNVILQAEKVLESLRSCRDYKRGIHLSSWGISQAELAQKHKQEHVRELQLLHVPRAVQTVLLSGQHAGSQDSAQIKMLEKVRDLHKNMHRVYYICIQHESDLQANSSLTKAKQLNNLTANVAGRLRSNQELTKATDEAKQFIKKQDHVEALVKHTDAQLVRNRENRLKQITFRTRLREVAMAQMRELSNLRNQKSIWIKRSFPTFSARNTTTV